jgi:hypothetical protein
VLFPPMIELSLLVYSTIVISYYYLAVVS